MKNAMVVLVACGCALPLWAESAMASDSLLERPRGTYILQPPPSEPVEPLVGRRTIYMNRNGGVYTPGNDDASKNVSAIPLQTSTVSAWSYGDTDWNRLMTCMRDVFAPFDVEITDLDPGNRVHVEAVIGGMPGDVQLPDDVAGVASSIGCDVLESGVVFAFSEVWREYGSGHVESTCITAAQEVGHAYGLDHQLTCGDPMTYLGCAGSFEFHDEEADCGEDQPRACSCQGNTQNSYAHLLALLGPAPADDPIDEPEGPQEDPGDEDPADMDSTGKVVAGCSLADSSSGGPLALLLVLLCLLRARRRTLRDDGVGSARIQ